MTYDPGYGNTPAGGPPPPYADDRSPVPDVSQPIGGYPPPAPYGPAPVSGPGGPPVSGPGASSPPASGPGVSGLPASPPYGSSYPGYPGGQVAAQVDPGPRPATVTTAVMLTYLGLALAILGTVLHHVFWSQFFAKITEGSVEAAETFETMAGYLTFIAGGLNLFAGAGALICAIFAMRGSNGARITLCVLCGAFAAWKTLCGGYYAIGVIQALQEEADQTHEEILGDLLPYLYGAVAIDFVLLILAAVILVLLVLRASNQYFNPPRVMATPTY